MLLFFLFEVGKGIYDSFKDSVANEVFETSNDKKEREDTAFDFYVVKKDDYPVDSAFNQKQNAASPYIIKKITTPVSLPFYVEIIMILIALPILVLAGFMLVYFVKLIISVLKRDIFIRENVRRIRVFSYGLLGMYIFIYFVEYFAYRMAESQLIIEGYKIDNYLEFTSIMDLLLLVLFAEIFSMGVRIKEEQDLTI